MSPVFDAIMVSWDKRESHKGADIWKPPYESKEHS